MINLAQACKQSNMILGPAKKIATTETKHILKTASEAGKQLVTIDKATGEVIKTVVKEAPVDGVIRYGHNFYPGKQNITKVYNAKGELIQINRMTKLDKGGRIIKESVTNPNSENRVIKVIESAPKGGGMATVNETRPNNFNYGTSYWITPGEPKTKFFDGRSTRNMNIDYYMGF